MTENFFDWPAFHSEFYHFYLLRRSFKVFSLAFILRSENVCADALAKRVRVRGYLFSYVSQTDQGSLTKNKNKKKSESCSKVVFYSAFVD